MLFDLGRRAIFAAAAAAAQITDPIGPPLTLSYGPNAEQLGDLYLPPTTADKPFPVVVLIHGGFWQSPYRRDLMNPCAVDLCRSGAAVWNIE